MFKLILVDDEPLTLHHLKTFIKWEDYGFQLVAAFDRGEQALLYIKQNPPDAVITDISMPDVTGMDIAEYCFKHAPNTQVALVSAYRVFEYAKTAIKYDVTDYILKPITKDSFVPCLQSFYQTLVLKNRNDQHLYSGLPTDLVMFTKQQLFSDLLCGIITDEDELKGKFRDINLPDNSIEHPCIIFNIRIKNYPDYITNTWKHDPERLYYAVTYVLASIESQYEFSLIRHSYNNIEIIGLCLNEDDVNFTEAKRAVVEIQKNLISLLKLEHEITQTNYYNKLTELIRIRPTSVVEQIALQNDTINKVHEFIKNNFTKAISLDDIAFHVSLSKAYLCTYYKQQTNETFIDTLNKYRIEKAKALLEDPMVKSSVIYNTVGFQNKGHFYKLFKQYTGKTPAEYRDSRCCRKKTE